jgi:hypothetical protein
VSETRGRRCIMFVPKGFRMDVCVGSYFHVQFVNLPIIDRAVPIDNKCFAH